MTNYNVQKTILKNLKSCCLCNLLSFSFKIGANFACTGMHFCNFGNKTLINPPEYHWGVYYGIAYTRYNQSILGSFFLKSCSKIHFIRYLHTELLMKVKSRQQAGATTPTLIAVIGVLFATLSHSTYVSSYQMLNIHLFIVGSYR